MPSEVLDSSAVLAYLLREPGGEIVEAARSREPVISSVNLSEIVARLSDGGVAERAIRTMLDEFHLTVIPFDTDFAYRVGLLRPLTKHLGLSLGDRACLALAQRLNLPVLTADRAWAGLSLGIAIQVIR